MTTPEPLPLHGSHTLFDGGFAYAASVPAGATLFTAGISPLDSTGRVDMPDDLTGQLVSCLTNLGVLLAEQEASFARIAKLTVYLATADRTDLARAWEVVIDHCGDRVPPAVIVAVTVLPYPGQVVELDAVVAL